jgi:membrane protease YdiL (CAAX protease family)
LEAATAVSALDRVVRMMLLLHMRWNTVPMNFLSVPQRFPLTSFFVAAYAWTWLCWWSVVAGSSGRLLLPAPMEDLATLGQFGPFAAALGVTCVTSGRAGLRDFLGRLVQWRVGPAWLAVSLLLLPATMLVAILLYASFHGTVTTLQFPDTWTTLPAHFIYTLLLCGPLGEEPGWRGFALPRLQAKYGSVAASIGLGLLWAGWHLPLWWMYPPPSPFPLYMAGAVLVAILFTWLFNHTSGSVLYSLIFHASLSTASVRLPDVPAYHVWVTVLLTLVLVILLGDRRLGQPRDGINPVALHRRRSAPIRCPTRQRPGKPVQ